MTDLEDTSAVVRLTTGDAQLLLPALVRRGASVQLMGRGRVDVRGMGAADVARIAASSNARVADLETIRSADGADARPHAADERVPA